MSHIEKSWRPATAADVARALAGEVVEARFRDSEIHVWTSVRRLIGARVVEGPETVLRWLDCASSWRYCQVYAPPQWFLDKPEPGEGYRLLEKEPDEPVQGGDFAFDRSGGWIELRSECSPTQAEGIWYRRRIEPPKPEPGEGFRLLGKSPDEPVQGGDFIKHAGGWNELANECNPTQQEGYWYRRRIEPPKPEPKFKVGQRVRVARPKQKTAQNGGSDIDEFFGYADIIASVRENVGKFTSYVLEHIDERAFPEDYLEPAVEPEPKHYTFQVGETGHTPSGHRITITEHGVEVT